MRNKVASNQDPLLLMAIVNTQSTDCLNFLYFNNVKYFKNNKNEKTKSHYIQCSICCK